MEADLDGYLATGNRNSGEYFCPPVPTTGHLLSCPNKKKSVLVGRLHP